MNFRETIQLTTNNRQLIVLYGTTGVGKTKLSITLSHQLSAPIISSDSRQVFREMNIGTAVPTDAELAAAPHHLIHSHSITDHFSAGDFEKQALKILDNLFKEHPVVLLVGGSGLYINALLYGFDDLPSDASIRANLNTKDLHELQDLLRELDPVHATQVDIQNIARVRRAIEICLVSGKPYSAQRLGEVKQRDFEVIKIGIARPREELYERINCRVDEMIAQGLENEVRKLYNYRHLPALQTVGYREFFDYFDGLTTLERAIELIKQNTRHYAKRQTTWLRREHGITWFDADKTQDILSYISDKINAV